MAEKDDKSKKEEKKQVAKKEPEVNPKKKTENKKEEVKKAPEKKAKETKKPEEKVQENTNTTIETNKGAVDTAPKSVKPKRKKNGFVVFLTIVVFLLIAAIGFFAVLYYTDSDLLRKDSSINTEKDNTSEKSKSNSKEKGKLTAIDLDKFEKVFKEIGWKVEDLTKFINTSENPAKEVITAIETGNTSSASLSIFANNEDANQFYEDSKERLNDVFDTAFDNALKNEEAGKNWEKYTLKNGDKSQVGYGIIVRVDDTVFVITTETNEENVNKAMKKLGY